MSYFFISIILSFDDMRSIYKKWSIHPPLFFIQFFFDILVTYSAFLHNLIRLPFSSLSAFSSNSLFLTLFAGSTQRFTKTVSTSSYRLLAIFPSSPFVLPSTQSNSTPLPHLSSSSSILIPWISFSLVSFAYHSSRSSGTLLLSSSPSVPKAAPFQCAYLAGIVPQRC